MSKKSNQAAEKFLSCITRDIELTNEDQHVLQRLVQGAFALYQEDWGTTFNIACWQYPFDQYASLNPDSFSGPYPWDVLLKKAVELCQTRGRPKGR
jgi:hypothetical protein